MNKILTISLLIGISFTTHLAATPLHWNLNSSTDDCNNWGVGNSCKFASNTGEEIKVNAYSTDNNNGTGAFAKATLTVWSGGIGVKNPFDTNESGSPNHATDNSGKDDLVVFQHYNPSYLFTGFQIGWKSSDADITAWIGGNSLGANYDFTGTHFSDLAGLGFTKFTFNNVPVNTTQDLDPDTIGRYLIIAPTEFDPSTNCGRRGRSACDQYDYFKISQISGDEPVTVPEPGTLALFGVALFGFWLSSSFRNPRLKALRLQ